MRYTLFWKPRAEADLAAMWLAARDRQRLSEVTARVEERPRRVPESVGESRDGAQRILHDNPLAFLFEVDASNRLVRVLSVWRYD